MGSGARQETETAGQDRLDSKRNVILKSAKAEFLRGGFGDTSMDTIAAHAGVSKMTVYRHFGSKEALFAGVIADLCDRIVEDDLDEYFTLSPEDALREFARKMIATVFAPETVELHRIVVAESRRFPKLGRMFYASGPEACIATLEAYLMKKRNDPRFKIRDPRLAAEEFLELLRGYAHLRALLGIEKKPSRLEMDARVENAIRSVMA